MLPRPDVPKSLIVFYPNKIFQKIEKENKGKVEIFFCGANEFGKRVQEKCEKYKFKFSHEYF
jgi:hypothetical protein